MRSTRRSGYTLVEMSVVILLLALFAALTAPNLGAALRGQEARSFRQDLKALVRTASAEAALRHRTVALRTDGQAVSLTLDEAGQESLEPEVTIRRVPLAPNTQVAEAMIGQRGVSFEEFGIRFFPDGTAESGGLQFVSESSEFYLVVRSAPVRAEVESGPMPPPTVESWEAGDIETRIPSL